MLRACFIAIRLSPSAWPTLEHVGVMESFLSDHETVNTSLTNSPKWEVDTLPRAIGVIG